MVSIAKKTERRGILIQKRRKIGQKLTPCRHKQLLLQRLSLFLRIYPGSYLNTPSLI